MIRLVRLSLASVAAHSTARRDIGDASIPTKTGRRGVSSRMRSASLVGRAWEQGRGSLVLRTLVRFLGRLRLANLGAEDCCLGAALHVELGQN
jgi:putative exporter of polyketide antibiotics